VSRAVGGTGADTEVGIVAQRVGTHCHCDRSGGIYSTIVYYHTTILCCLRQSVGRGVFLILEFTIVDLRFLIGLTHAKLGKESTKIRLAGGDNSWLLRLFCFGYEVFCISLFYLGY
jgi:hypothetical protein